MTASGRKKQRGGRHNSGQTPPIIASPVPPPPQYSHEYHHRQDVMGPPIGHNHIPSQGPPGSTPHVYAPSGVFTGGGPQDFQTHNHFDIAPAMHTPVPVNNTSPYGQEAYSQQANLMEESRLSILGDTSREDYDKDQNVDNGELEQSSWTSNGDLREVPIASEYGEPVDLAITELQNIKKEAITEDTFEKTIPINISKAVVNDGVDNVNNGIKRKEEMGVLENVKLPEVRTSDVTEEPSEETTVQLSSSDVITHFLRGFMCAPSDGAVKDNHLIIDIGTPEMRESRSKQKYPEECPMCYTVLCPSYFRVNVMTFRISTVCTDCGLSIEFKDDSDSNQGKIKKKYMTAIPIKEKKN